MRYFVGLWVIAAVVSVVSFGAGIAGAATKPEACSLLRVKEIRTAFAQPTSKAKASSFSKVCDWKLSATDTRPIGSVHTLVERGSTARGAYKLASDFHVGDREPLTDLGKKAFYAPSLGTVWVLEDNSTVLYVQGIYPTGAQVDAASLREALLALADRAQARL